MSRILMVSMYQTLVFVQITDLVLKNQAHGSTGKNWLQLSPGKLLWNLSDQGKSPSVHY